MKWKPLCEREKRIDLSEKEFKVYVKYSDIPIMRVKKSWSLTY